MSETKSRSVYNEKTAHGKGRLLRASSLLLLISVLVFYIVKNDETISAGTLSSKPMACFEEHHRISSSFDIFEKGAGRPCPSEAGSAERND